MDEEALNYDPQANIDFGGVFCIYAIYGCTDSTAFNYNEIATDDDGSCIPVVEGCMDESALNFDTEANIDDGNCVGNGTISSSHPL